MILSGRIITLYIYMPPLICGLEIHSQLSRLRHAHLSAHFEFIISLSVSLIIYLLVGVCGGRLDLLWAFLSAPLDSCAWEWDAHTTTTSRAVCTHHGFHVVGAEILYIYAFWWESRISHWNPFFLAGATIWIFVSANFYLNIFTLSAFISIEVSRLS